MIAGRFAFQGLSEYLTWQKIKKLEYSFPEGFDEDAKDLVQKLLVSLNSVYRTLSNVFVDQVRVPNQRLGAGAPHDAHSMQALRAHPFLASINWKTLWTDPAPPLQPGLVRKEPAVRQAQARHADIGALWDSLVEGEQDKEDDGLSWAPDAEAPPYFFGRRAGYKARLPEAGSEEGPTDEGPQYTSSLSTRPEEEDTATIVGLSCREEGPPQSPSSNGTGSTSSSSDNSLDDGLGKLRIDRGRDRTPTPVQGNFQLDDVDL
jgi:3-phosphoinositide dependent protein kinase-1